MQSVSRKKDMFVLCVCLSVMCVCGVWCVCGVCVCLVCVYLVCVSGVCAHVCGVSVMCVCLACARLTGMDRHHHQEESCSLGAHPACGLGPAASPVSIPGAACPAPSASCPLHSSQRKGPQLFCTCWSLCPRRGLP